MKYLYVFRAFTDERYRFKNRGRNSAEHLVLKKLISIPLLAADKIIKGLDYLKEEVNRRVLDVKRVEKRNPNIFLH